MAILPVRELPDPMLRHRARKILKVDSSVLRLAYDMIDTMNEHQGVGLAANQVGVLKRLITVQLPDWEEAMALVNPEIIRRDGEREVEEGCLSVPGYRGIIRRSLYVKAKAINLDGKDVRIKAEDLLAQALEHEIDHLNGVLYIDHLETHEKLWKLESEEAKEAVSG